MTERTPVEPYVVASGLTLRYPGATGLALDDVSFAANRGEVVTLLGPSGCGKTTALRLIAGLETPDAGTVSIGGRDVTNEAPEHRKLGFVFQNYALFPHLSVGENVAFGLRVRREAREKTTVAVRDALALVGLEGLESRAVDQLSGGQQQRVALARALAIEPDVLLMDEPLSNLDTALREQTRDALRELLGRLNVTTFFVTHDQAEAFAFSHRVVLMRAGHVVETGPPDALYRRPDTSFAAEFLGAANLLTGAVVASGESVSVGGRELRVGSWSEAARALAPATAVTVVARQETLRLASSETENALPGRVVDRVFLGATSRVTVELDGSTERIRLQTHDDTPEGPVWVVCPVDALRAIGSGA